MSHINFPPLYKDEDDQDEGITNQILAYQKAACSKDNVERVGRFISNERKRLANGSEFWVDVSPGNELDEPFLEPTATADDVSLASQNEIAPIMDSETSRLIGSTSEPSVDADEPTTAAKRGARFSERILDQILFDCQWVEMQQRDARQVKLQGTSYLLTGYENDYRNMAKSAAKVFACKTCKGDDSWLVSEAAVEDQNEDGSLLFAGDAAEKFDAIGVGLPSRDLLGEPVVTIKDCPNCGSGLEARRATPEDGLKDLLGNPLTKDVPMAQAFIRLYSEYDVFFAGNGRMKHGFMPEVTIEEIVPIEWLMERYGAAHKVKPVSLSSMGKEARWHPSGLNLWGYYGASLANDQERWAIHRVTIRQPFLDTRENSNGEKMSEPMGRIICTANETVLMNGPLLIEHEKKNGEITYVPRMMLHAFQNELELDSVLGNSAADRLMDPQRSINAQLSQFEHDMATNGSPTIHINQDVNIEGQGDGMQADDMGYAGQILRSKGDGKIETITGQVTHQDWAKLIQMRVEAMSRTSNQSELDRGAAAAGAPSATAQLMIGQRLDESRKPIGQRYAERNGRAFGHILRCVNATYVEPRQLRAGYRQDKRAPRLFTAMDMMDQCTVKVSVKPAFQNPVFERQNTIELLDKKLIPMDTPGKILRVLKKLGLSEDVDPEPSQQLTAAENEWIDFHFGEPEPVAPIVKVRSDSHRLHIEKHYEDLRSPDGDALVQHWSLVELATEAWWEQFQAFEHLKLAAEQPLPEPTVVRNDIDGSIDMAATQGTIEAWAYKRQAKDIVNKQPKNVEQRIFLSMFKLLKNDPAFRALDEGGQRDAMMLTRWLAHIEAHEAAEAKRNAVPGVATTGNAPETPAGTAAPSPATGGALPGAQAQG